MTQQIILKLFIKEKKSIKDNYSNKMKHYWYLLIALRLRISSSEMFFDGEIIGVGLA